MAKKDPEYILAMRRVVRNRQNCYADYLDEIGWADLGLQEEGQPTYDWRYDIAKRWMPHNGVYRPQYVYVDRVKSGWYEKWGKPGEA